MFAGDGLGVAFVLILGVEEPLSVLLVLHAELLELAVEGLRSPAELLGYLCGGVGANGGLNAVEVAHAFGLLLDDLLLLLCLFLKQLLFGFGLFKALIKDLHCVGNGGIVVVNGGYACFE